MKKIIALLLLIVISISSVAASVYAETDKAEEMSGNLNQIISKMSILSRYPEVTIPSLYTSAMKAVFDENPELYDKVLKSVLSSIDENSAYFNEAEGKAFLQELNDEVTGIGVNVFANDGNIIVSEPIPGSPAENVGIKAGDIIVGADDFDLRTMEYEKALDKIRGLEGTEVKIQIIRSGISEPISFIIKREKVVLNPINYDVIEENGKKIGKIRIYSFTNTVADRFKETLNEIDKAGIKDIIIDVRDNGGGYLDQTIEIADMLLPKDAVITTEDHKMEVLNKRYTATGVGKKYNIVMLVNGYSASASEVLTAALCENNVAKSVGTKTFGKGTVQTMLMAPYGGFLKFTSAYYLTPSGENIHKVGVKPTVTVENSSVPVDMSEYEMFSLSKTYQIGDKGKEIELAKRMLKFLGVFVGEVNEVYDENLKIAVTTFQKLDKLFPYGVLDITTQLNLYDSMKTATVKKDDQLQTAIELFK